MESDRLSRELTSKLEEARMTAEALSLNAQLARDTVGRWIRGTTVPTPATLLEVEKVLSRQLGYVVDLAAAVSERRTERGRAIKTGRPAYWATVQEIRERTGTLIGRQDELADITSFAMGSEDYRWLVGEAWAGKTSLLAEAVTALSGNFDVVCYFLSRREADADSSRFLAAVVPQLASLLRERPPPAGLHEFRDLWRRAAAQADAEGRHLLLVVDGLDEDLRPPGLPSVAALLPANAVGRAHVLVSSRPHPKLPDDIAAGHALRRTRSMPVQPFSGSRELAVLARQEIDDLLRRDDDGLGADVLGLLTAAAGPLAVRDLAAMTVAVPPFLALTRRIRGLLNTSTARSLQRVRLAEGDRYQFAHESLLADAQADDDLSDPSFRRRIHQWAEGWQAAGWPVPAGGEKGTPQYLLDTYPSTLADDPQRLTQLTADIGWVEAAVQSVGVDRVLADLHRAAAANPASEASAAILAVVILQAHNLRPRQPLDQPGYVLRHLWMQAAELAEDDLARDIRGRLQSRTGPRLVPQWTTHRTSRALSVELGWHSGAVRAVAVLADGRVIAGGDDGRVLVWDPAAAGNDPVELGRHNGAVLAVAALPDGRVVTGGDDGRVLVWDPAAAGNDPVELGRHNRAVLAVAALPDGRVVTGGGDRQLLVWDPAAAGSGLAMPGRPGGAVRAVAVLADGRVIAGRSDGRVLVWDPAAAGNDPVELGRHNGPLRAVAVLPDGQAVTGGTDREVLVWDPAWPGSGLAVPGRPSVLLAVAALPDGRVIAGRRDGRVLVWDPAAAGNDPVELGRHNRAVLAVAALPDGRVITGGDDRRVLVWDPVTAGSPVQMGRRRGGVVRAVAVLPDGRVVTGGSGVRLQVWAPVPVGNSQAMPGRRIGPVQAVAALPDGRVIVGVSDGRVLVWDPATAGNDLIELGRHNGAVLTVAVLPDRRVVTSGTDARVLVWDPATAGNDPIELGRHDRRVLAVAALPDGRVVTSGTDRQLLVWDPATAGSPVQLGRRRGSEVRAMAALPDGRVVTGGSDRRVLLWDSASVGTVFAELRCSVTALASANLGQAGFYLVIAHEGTGMSLWSITR